MSTNAGPCRETSRPVEAAQGQQADVGVDTTGEARYDRDMENKHMDIMDINNSRSYTSQTNLQRALQRKAWYFEGNRRVTLADAGHIECRTEDGRWTAIFPLHRLQNVGLSAMAAANHGFLTV